jgi:hypothetical protein
VCASSLYDQLIKIKATPEDAAFDKQLKENKISLPSKEAKWSDFYFFSIVF